MRKLILIPCVALLTAAAPASGATPPPNASQVAAPTDMQQPISLNGGKAAAQPTEEKKICKQLPTSGSRLPNRACLTAKEWKQVESQADQ